MELAPSALTSKCLCREHNSSLSLLDAAAAQLFSELELADTSRTAPARKVLISGHDIERWLLKTLYTMAHSGNLAANKQPLQPIFAHDIDIGVLLDDPVSWPVGTGLYFTQTVGDGFVRSDTIHLQPISRSAGREIVGMNANLQGLPFSLWTVLPPQGAGSYRPGRLSFKQADGLQNDIHISWEDTLPHGYVEVQAVGRQQS